MENEITQIAVGPVGEGCYKAVADKLLLPAKLSESQLLRRLTKCP